MNNRRAPGMPTPALGALDTVSLPPERGLSSPDAEPAPAGAGAARAVIGWALALSALLAVGLALVHWRENLGRLLVPDAPLTRQLVRAESALQRGELSRADGQGARELFQAALAVDPDNPRARQGLQAVRAAALTLAATALDRGERQPAADALDLATALSAPASAVEPLRQRLQTLDQPEDALEQDLALAQSLVQQARLDEALVVFERVLQQLPDNALALEGRRQVLAIWLTQANALLDDGKLDQAQAVVANVQRYDPAHLDLPPVQARLGEQQSLLKAVQAPARTLAQPQPTPTPPAPGPAPQLAHAAVRDPAIERQRLPGLLARASAAIDAGHLLQPADDNAWTALQTAVAIAPEDAAVNEALARFEQAARECFERQALANRLSDAETCLDARRLRESPQALADARRRLALRWLALGNERLGQNEPELAQHALASARRLDDRAPGLTELERRLALVLGAGQRR